MAKKNELTKPRKPKKPHLISDFEKEQIKQIAAKAKRLRIASSVSYEEFAKNADINRNSYFRFEKAAESGENITLVLLLKVIRGLNMSVADFFQDIR